MIEFLESRRLMSTTFVTTVAAPAAVAKKPVVIYPYETPEPKIGSNVTPEMYDLFSQEQNTLKAWLKGSKNPKFTQDQLDDINNAYGTSYELTDIPTKGQQMVEDYVAWLISQFKQNNNGTAPTTEQIVRMYFGGPNGYNNPNTLQYWNQYCTLQRLYGATLE